MATFTESSGEEMTITAEQIKKAAEWINRQFPGVTAYEGHPLWVIGKVLDEAANARQQTNQSLPPLGTAVQAIEFALTGIDDAWTDRCAFLEAWQHGDISEWPEYKAMIAEVKK